MAAIGVITLEMKLDHARSLKDKRQVVRSLKDRLRHRYNVAVAEIDFQNLWQRGLLAAVTVSANRAIAQHTLEAVEQEAVAALGPMLVDVTWEWIE